MPIGPMFGEPNPEDSVCLVELNPTPLASSQDIQLVPKSNNLQLSTRPGFEEEDNDAKERTEPSFHGTREIIRLHH